MTRAAQIVAELLEDDTEYRADSDPPHRRRIPAGFVATDLVTGDVAETRYSQHWNSYRFTKHWTDPYTGERRSIESGACSYPTPEQAQAFIEKRVKDYEDAGWKVQRLPDPIDRKWNAAWPARKPR
jgi:hypothetical protein